MEATSSYADQRFVALYDSLCQELEFTCVPADGGPPPDAAYYLRLIAERRAAGRAGSPFRVLELGTGTARVATALVRGDDEVQVTGIDSSPFMLEHARAKAARLTPAQQSRLHLHQADWHDYNVGEGAFDLAVCPFNTFQLNTTIEQQDRFLREVFRHLRPGGIVVLDLFVPMLARLAVVEEPRRKRRLAETVEGEPWIEHERIVRQITNQTFEVCFDYTPANEPDAVPAEHRFTMTWFLPRELRRMLAANGYVDLEVIDGYRGGPVRDDSQRQVAIGVRP